MTKPQRGIAEITAVFRRLAPEMSHDEWHEFLTRLEADIQTGIQYLDKLEQETKTP